jgi:small GTP-binding protein
MAADPVDPPSRKVAFLGDSGVGKTCIIGFYLSGSFQSATTTMSPACSKIDYSADGHTVFLNVWDTAGQERFQSMTNIYVRNAFAVALVFDITAPASYSHLETWLELCHQSEPSPRLYFIVGNKLDLDHTRKITHEDADRWAVANNAVYLEVSAVTGEGVRELFAAIGRGVLDVLYDKGLDEEVDLGLKSLTEANAKKGKCC